MQEFYFEDLFPGPISVINYDLLDVKDVILKFEKSLIKELLKISEQK